MKNYILIIATALISIPAGILSQQSIDGWYKAGSSPDSYVIGAEDEKRNGRTVYFIKSIDEVSGAFGAMSTGIQPGNFSGKRIRLSGYIKTKDVVELAGMWMRVDGTDPNKMLAFDNMSNRPIKGSNDWTQYEIVLDIAPESANIAYGVLLRGTGEIWFTDFIFEVVDDSVPSTDMLK
jgi:hypothetical protein